MDMKKAKGAGKLILWHGVPGTGKTFAIRALAHEWKDWATFEYITDPENFFSDTSYMLYVLLNGEASYDSGPTAQYNYDMSYEDDDEEVPESKKKDKWKVLVLEDAGELIEIDAKEKTGQALSRLLNVAEGLIGQGMKVLILITTNEKITKLNPAVHRAGRCLAEIEFKKFNTQEASKWFESKSVNLNLATDVSLADMFALVEDPNHKIAKDSFGYSPGH